MMPRVIIQFNLPAEVANGFPKLIDKVRRHIVRQAIRSALVPVKNNLKTKLMSLPSETQQSSGATLRALTSKYANSKRNPDRFYGIVGINRKLWEYFDPTDKSPVYKNAKMRQVNFGIKTNRFNDDGSAIYSKKWRPKEVKSTLKRNYGVKGGLRSPHRKRRPNNYWHLVESGFSATDTKGPWAGKRTRVFGGHHFVQRTYTETRSQAVQIFEAKVVDHFRKAFK